MNHVDKTVMVLVRDAFEFSRRVRVIGIGFLSAVYESGAPFDCAAASPAERPVCPPSAKKTAPVRQNR
jgi:hypothetical protein